MNPLRLAGCRHHDAAHKSTQRLAKTSRYTPSSVTARSKKPAAFSMNTRSHIGEACLPYALSANATGNPHTSMCPWSTRSGIQTNDMRKLHAGHPGLVAHQRE